MKPNEEITLNTNLCPLVVPDTYGTFNHEFFSDGFDEDNQFCDEEMNYKELERIMRLYADSAWKSDNITSVLYKLGLKFVHVGNFYSPKEYNFATDDFGLVFETADDYSDDNLFAYAKELSKSASANQYLADNYTSRDGFWSMTPNTFDGLIESIKEDENIDRCIAALIMVAISEEVIGYSSYQREFENDVCEQCSPIEYKPYVNEDLIELYNQTDLCQEVWNTLKYQKLAKYEMWKGNESILHENCDHDDDAVNMVIWATRKGYSAEDLIRMAS